MGQREKFKIFFGYKLDMIRLPIACETVMLRVTLNFQNKGKRWLDRKTSSRSEGKKGGAW